MTFVLVPSSSSMTRFSTVVWCPRFLSNVINANDRISRVKPAEHWSNLGQPGSSPRKPR
jgi:hypothetical protein